MSVVSHVVILLFFLRRTAFCLDVHNDAVKGLRFPPDEYTRRKEEEEANRKKEKDKKKKEDKDGPSEDEIIKQIQDQLDEEDF